MGTMKYTLLVYSNSLFSLNSVLIWNCVDSPTYIYYEENNKNTVRDETLFCIL
jgi:hypothetical protein